MSDELPWVDAKDWRLLTAKDFDVDPKNGGVPLPANLCLRCGVRIYGWDVKIHDDWHEDLAK